MKRSGVIRFLLLLLVAATLLVLWRARRPSPLPDGLVAYSDIPAGRLLQETLRVEEPVRVLLDVVGSFEADEDSENRSLAAYGWVLRREDRAVVWDMPSASPRRRGNTLAVVTDTVELSPGAYDVYFASYGNQDDSPLGLSFLDGLLDFSSDDRHAWRSDAEAWRMTVRPLGDSLAERIYLDSEAPAFPPGEETLLWTSAPMEGREVAEYMFRTTRPGSLRVYAVGEINGKRMDFGWIEEAFTGERAWDMRRGNTTPAGGWEVNRLFDGTVSLEPGLYRTVFRTDPRQNYEDWVRNPPFDPAGWGVSLFSAAPEAVEPFDLRQDREPFIRMHRVGDDERRVARFRVRTPVRIAVDALGEMGDEDERYDYATITAGRSGRVVWDMTQERSLPAGGYDNWRALAFLNLSPGVYAVSYQTDGSHSYDGWLHGEPDHPERWGVALFRIDGDAGPDAIEVLGADREAFGESLASEEDSAFSAASAAVRGRAPGRFPVEGALVDLTGIGNREHVSAPFAFDGEGFLRIRAVGETSLSGQYDYGWIEDAETGETVWEMTWQNTMPAGGDARNRMFLGALSLPAGEYAAHFRTDFSHAYGDFGDIPPDDPEAWGIRVFVAGAGTESTNP